MTWSATRRSPRGPASSSTATADLLTNIADPFAPGVSGRRLLSLVNEDKLRRILARMLDEERFLGPARDPVDLALASRPPLCP